MSQGRQAGHTGDEQYFSAQPGSPDVRRTINVTLAGRPVKVQVSNGVFSSSRLDLGTSVLLKRAPEPPESGDFLDLGCGWGPIALELALLRGKARVWAVDVNERALDLTRANAQTNGLTNIRATLPDDLPGGQGFDLIWSNPPIRVGKAVLHQLLMDYLPRLNPGGAAYLVVQRNLGSDSLITWLSSQMPTDWGVAKYASAKGYRVIEVARP
ncbi:16S RNA methylase [Bifidobacterium actinocoloniiforme DSM 22766]|uniref:16S RNA methylase n=1 Tax=Bifidobacterium actinocoloniiforme DSM 22766 TaxID=1437605 RepID=A0A086YZQ5_9BIFI|nr:MFS transporter [Bifidobacterium actinocoloniiforme DSM 22766]KFI39755.1 16S RNA methylase [Bifidobacterium actinocoloniiforme DSM 22766]